MVSRDAGEYGNGVLMEIGLATTSGQENLKNLNADNISRFYLYDFAMQDLFLDNLSWPYACISSAYIPPNPFPASCPADAVARLPPVPISTASNVTSSSNSDSPRSPSHLSHAVTAGIAVGCVLTTSLLAMGAYFVVYKRRRGVIKHAEPWSKGELPADDVDYAARGLGPEVADSTAIAEVEDARPMLEFEGRSAALEIEGGSTEIFEAPADLSALPELMATEH